MARRASISSHCEKSRHLAPSGSAMTAATTAVTLVPHEPRTALPALLPSSHRRLLTWLGLGLGLR